MVKFCSFCSFTLHEALYTCGVIMHNAAQKLIMLLVTKKYYIADNMQAVIKRLENGLISRTYFYLRDYITFLMLVRTILNIFYFAAFEIIFLSLFARITSDEFHA